MKKVKRVVVKVGTKLLVDAEGRLSHGRMNQLVRELDWLLKSGREVVLVSSGAIVTGLEALGMKRRPRALPELQAAAAIGQGLLLHLYQEIFSRYKIRIAQVLLTREDLKERHRHLNAKNTFEALLGEHVLPIVNENDTVAVEEIKFGDNDQLSALVTDLVQAELLVILTDQDGFLKEGSVVPMVFEINEDLQRAAHRANDWKGVGGMQSKLEAARMLMRSGAMMLIANGHQKGIMEMIFQDHRGGSLFVPKGRRLSGKKRWIAHFVKPQGSLILDEGAVAAICKQGKSLLAPGIVEVRGSFKAGETVSILDAQAIEVARGLVAYDADTLREMKKNILGGSAASFKEVIHRNNLVIL